MHVRSLEACLVRARILASCALLCIPMQLFAPHAQADLVDACGVAAASLATWATDGQLRHATLNGLPLDWAVKNDPRRPGEVLGELERAGAGTSARASRSNDAWGMYLAALPGEGRETATLLDGLHCGDAAAATGRTASVEAALSFALPAGGSSALRLRSHGPLDLCRLSGIGRIAPDRVAGLLLPEPPDATRLVSFSTGEEGGASAIEHYRAQAPLEEVVASVRGALERAGWEETRVAWRGLEGARPSRTAQVRSGRAAGLVHVQGRGEAVAITLIQISNPGGTR